MNKLTRIDDSLRRMKERPSVLTSEFMAHNGAELNHAEEVAERLGLECHHKHVGGGLYLVTIKRQTAPEKMSGVPTIGD